MSVSACTPAAFSYPSIHGTVPISIQANVVHNYSGNPGWFPEIRLLDPTKPPSFCNVTVTYTHPGHDDAINTRIWLPLSTSTNPWNERYASVGGGGFSTGDLGGDAHTIMVSRGFATAGTDGGHDHRNMLRADEWILLNPGNLNWPLFVDYAYRALEELPVIGKAIAEQFYGQKPRFSYWHGCSTGGRQGLLAAQRFPWSYDGILAMCPAINVPTLSVGGLAAQFVMNSRREWPRGCEVEEISRRVIEACDELDGVKDEIIADPDRCKFDASSVVGQKIDCEGETITVSATAAEAVKAVWFGVQTPRGKTIGYGGGLGARLSGMMSMTETKCSKPDDQVHPSCTGVTFPIFDDWVKLFVKKNPDFDYSKMTVEEYEELLQLSTEEFESIMSTTDPDLRRAKKAGTKIINWHSIDDELLPFRSTREYYDKVLAGDPNAKDYYRYYEVPGIGHCSSGKGAYPYKAFEALMKWVEEDVAPDMLVGEHMTAEGRIEWARPICAYPLVASFNGGDVSELSSYTCSGSFALNQAKESGRDEL